jgi:hypothetical protein
MLRTGLFIAVPFVLAAAVGAAVTQGSYTWENVKIGGGGGQPNATLQIVN